MIRPVLTELILFLVPFALYAVFLWATKSKILDPESWPVSRLVSLTIVAFLLMIGSFIYFAQFRGAAPGSTYVPAHIENGKFVPGRAK